MNRTRLVEVATRLLAAGLFAVSVLGLVFSFQQGDTDGVVTGLFAVYLTGLLLAGTLRDGMNDRRWQLAFFGGVGVWGGYEYATTGDLFSLLFAGIGVLMVVANLLDAR
ncbi:hypothetical protein [Halorussus litoreus]|uniref:hypothetical protein n=1 Tax=Halorussus litoreus TaxID=1710536 RepID=UPI000E2811E3|nr:hypothetical protein [Halorussus litoreus]